MVIETRQVSRRLKGIMMDRRTLLNDDKTTSNFGDRNLQVLSSLILLLPLSDEGAYL